MNTQAMTNPPPLAEVIERCKRDIEADNHSGRLLYLKDAQIILDAAARCEALQRELETFKRTSLERAKDYAELMEINNELRADIKRWESATGEDYERVKHMERELAKLQKGRCEHCGGKVSHYESGCPYCGAPECCDMCCKLATRDKHIDSLITQRDTYKRAHTAAEAELAKLRETQSAPVDGEPDLTGCGPNTSIAELRAWGRSLARFHRKIVDSLILAGDLVSIEGKSYESQAYEIVAHIDALACKNKTLARENAELKRELAEAHQEKYKAEKLALHFDEQAKELAAQLAALAKRSNEIFEHFSRDTSYYAGDAFADLRRAIGNPPAAAKALLDRLEKAEQCQPCGHPMSLLVKSVESDYQFCQLCEANARLRDALQQERDLLAERDRLKGELEAAKAGSQEPPFSTVDQIHIQLQDEEISKLKGERHELRSELFAIRDSLSARASKINAVLAAKESKADG